MTLASEDWRPTDAYDRAWDELNKACEEAQDIYAKPRILCSHPGPQTYLPDTIPEGEMIGDVLEDDEGDDYVEDQFIIDDCAAYELVRESETEYEYEDEDDNYDADREEAEKDEEHEA